MPTLTYDLRGQQPALVPDTLILVTGVTGLIGGHVADKLLAAGYRVRGTTRSAARATWTTEHFSQIYGPGRYEVAEVADMHDRAAYSAAMDGVRGVAHVASDLSMSDKADDVIPPTQAHVRGILHAAGQHPEITRFVYTSSSTALTEPKPGEKLAFTVKDWNDESIAKVQTTDPKPSGFTVYAASKALGEQEAWKFMQEQRPSFVLNTILPNMNYGRTLHASQNPSTSAAADRVWKAGGMPDPSGLPPPQWFVDVEDTALLHVAALVDPEIAGERIAAFAEPFNWSRVLEAWKHVAPEKEWGEVDKNEKKDEMSFPIERGGEILRRFEEGGTRHRGWTTMEESLTRKLDADRKFGRK